MLCIGPIGESMSRTVCLIHETGYATGQGGFGGIWGSKNLKAISIVGTGSVEIADPKALLDARLWMERDFSCGNKGKSSANGCFGCMKQCQGKKQLLRY